MFVLVLISVFVSAVLSAGTNTSSNDLRTKKMIKKDMKVLNLNESHFATLENYEVNAVAVTEKQYPWIARVVHSRSKNVPHVCTATCIDPGIFITAARCLYTLKVNYTTIIYRSKRLFALAFVLPSKMTKQGFDDIGFVVVQIRNVKGKWDKVDLFNNVNRTDGVFKWFENLAFKYAINSTVIGYAAKKGIHKIKSVDRHFNLTALNVVIGLDICSKILTDNKTVRGFYVPCYYSCSFSQFLRNHKPCYNYHGVEGGAVFDSESKKLLGVATWGSYYSRFELPVGFAFANSDSFFKDYTCARIIRDNKKTHVTKGYYQSLCSGL